MTTDIPFPAQMRADPWRPFLVLGLVVFLLGAVALGSTLLDLASFLVFAPVFLGAGILEVFIAFLFRSGKEALLSLLAAGLNMVLGFLILANPHLGGLEISLAIALVLIAFGLVSAGRAYAARKSQGWWLLVAGLAALLLAACVWLRWPLPGFWFIGVCLGLDLLVYGMMESASSLTVREFQESRGLGKPAQQSPVGSTSLASK